MPSSRASSPLSSATPSPPPSPSRPLRSAWLDAGVSPSSRRHDRSPTSSTAPFSQDGSPPPDQDDNDEESDLTEEEDEDEGVRPAVPMMRQAREESLEDDGEGEEDEQVEDDDDAEMDEDEAVGPKPRSHERRLVQSRTTSKSASRSPSLTPPPPSVLLKARELTGSPKREDRLSAVDDEEQDEDGEEGNDVNIVGEDASLSAKESLDPLDGPVKGVTDGDDDDVDPDADDDGEGDGDITMRPVDEDEPEEADPVDGVNGDEEATGTTNGLPSVFVEDQDADADADADADEDQGETGPAEEEEEEHEAPDTPKMPIPTKLHPSHAPPPTSAHMRALLILELKFAALRDKLFIERMEEAAAEEQMLLDGTHPALQHLYKTLAERRERLHEVASRRHQEAVNELKRAREADKEHTWSWWTEQRDSLHWEEFDRTWSKRRRLAREKNELETPRIVKPLPQVGHRPKGVDWSTGVGPAKMSMDDASADLAMMDPRTAQARAPRLSRHASPATFGHHAVTAASQPHANAPAPVPAPSASLAQRPVPAAASSQPPPTFPYNTAHVYQPPPRQQNAQHTAYRPPQPPHQPPAQTRPLGRTVPTTSDLFESGRKDSSTTPMAWTKPDTRPPNGHAHTTLTAASAAIPGAKGDERTPTRFPGLSEYLNSSKQAMATMPGLPHSHAQTQSALGLGLGPSPASHSQPVGTAPSAQNGSSVAGSANGSGAAAAGIANGGGPAPVSAAPPAAGTTAPSYASMLTAGGKMLSPPKAGTTSLLGTFGVRPAGPFGQTPGAPAASATPAGTNAGRS